MNNYPSVMVGSDLPAFDDGKVLLHADIKQVSTASTARRLLWKSWTGNLCNGHLMYQIH